MEHLTIAIDGPASSGKSTIAKQLAERLEITYIDTGAMYRAVTLAVLKKQLKFIDITQIKELLTTLEIVFKRVNGVQHTFLNGQDVSEEIRSVEVTQSVSEISAMAFVREQLVAQQQAMAKHESVVMDGRDIGTVVLPQAHYKFYFIADVEVRAQRRYQENIAKGITTQTLEQLKADIEARDLYDSTREVSPLRPADDAIHINTSNDTIEQVTQKLLTYIQKTENNNENY